MPTSARLHPAPADASDLRRALRRAQRVFWQTQLPDGSWDAMGDMGPSPTAQVVIGLQHLGALEPDDAVDAARWLRSQQRLDGSFVLHPFAREGDVGATACAWAALHLAAPAESAAAIARARSWLEARGGERRILEGLERGDLAAVFLSLAGLIDPRKLPCPSAAFAIIPGVLPALQTRFHSGVLMVALQLNVIARRLRGDFGPDGRARGLFARAECRAAIDLLLTFQNQDGSWNANTLQGALALPALHAAGLGLEDPRIVKGIAWLHSQRLRDASGLRFHAFSSAVWSTAFDLRALFASGVPASDPEVERALTWLVESQLEIPQPAVDNRNPGAPRVGGWAFQRGNHTMADSDDAGVVLSAFGEALAMSGPAALSPALRQRVQTSVRRGQDWLLGMQNPDGGWSAFVWGLPGKRPGPAMRTTPRARLDDPLAMLRFVLEPEPALGDPSTEDVTSRILHGLGRCGFDARHPAVSKAIEFLRRQQCDHGGWWGRWVVNHLAATSFVLMGLRAVGFDLRTPWVQNAVRWVIERQNADGGWGEGAASYADPGLAGIGPSMAPLTGLVLQGLLDAGEGGSDAVKRGVAHLLRRQQPDGTWPNDDYLHANVPPDTFYFYPEAPKFYCTEALARYAAFLRDPSPPPEERWPDSELDAARGRTDLLADKVVSAVFARGAVEAVNDLMGCLFRSDSPIPEGLPPEAREYFEATGTLPPWAEPAKIALAQGLFARAGWEVATSLFCSSLPQAYAAAKGAAVLTQTGAMTRHVRQRIFETAQFVFDVLDEGGLSPGGRGIRSAQKVRLMHAGIRHLLLTRTAPEWPSQERGLPINQEDLAGTLLTFSMVTLDGIARLGIAVSAEEGEAWIHTWKAIGVVLGLEERLLPHNLEDARALMDAIRDRQWAPSEEGRALTRRLVELMADFVPGQAFDGVPVALIRYLAGDHCADLLGLPSTDWMRHLVEAAELVEPVLELGDRELGLSRLFERFRQQIMHAVVNVEREGKQARFRIPASLRNSLGDS